MKITKLDRDKIKERQPDRAKPVSPEQKKEIEKKKREAGERRKSAKKTTRRKIPKKRMLIYLAAGVTVAAVSLIYNITEFSEMQDPGHLAPAEQKSSVKAAFYDLCLRLEQIRIQEGTYPSELGELKFSPNLNYILRENGTFLLSYEEGGNQIRYDSSEDSVTKEEETNQICE